MKVPGSVAVISGGASGIGLAMARAIAERGGRVAIFDLNEAGARRAAESVGRGSICANVDVANEASVAAGIDQTMRAFGAIHICINCAGIGIAHRTVGKDGPFPLADWNKTLAVNLTGSINVLRLCAERMAKNSIDGDYAERGVIINTASTAAFEGQIGQAAYSASKAGIVGMTLAIARDLASIGVRVNTVAPGLVETPLLSGLSSTVLEQLGRSVLFPSRLGRPEEVAHLMLCLIENTYINGECIRIDGGIRMQPR